MGFVVASRLRQGAGDAEAVDGDGVAEPFTKARGRVGMGPLDLGRQVAQCRFGLLGVGHGPGPGQLSAHRSVVVLGQQVGDVPGLVGFM